MEIKYTYIRDTPPEQPDPPQLDKKGNVIKLLSPRVVTIGRMVEGDAIRFAVTINKVVSPEEYHVDQRIRPIVGPAMFKEIQKRLRRRYGGDVHCKKAARNIIKGRFYAGRTDIVERTMAPPPPAGHEDLVAAVQNKLDLKAVLRVIATNTLRGEEHSEHIPLEASTVCMKALTAMVEEEDETKRLVGASRQG